MIFLANNLEIRAICWWCTYCNVTLALCGHQSIPLLVHNQVNVSGRLKGLFPTHIRTINNPSIHPSIYPAIQPFIHLFIYLKDPLHPELGFCSARASFSCLWAKVGWQYLQVASSLQRQTTIRVQLTPTDPFLIHLTRMFCAFLCPEDSINADTKKTCKLSTERCQARNQTYNFLAARQNSDLCTFPLHTPRHSLENK